MKHKQAERDQFERSNCGDISSDKSEETFDAADVDFDEYLVDINDGMDVEDVIADAGYIEIDPRRGQCDNSLGDGQIFFLIMIYLFSYYFSLLPHHVMGLPAV